MSSAPWSNETERADYYKSQFNNQLAITDNLQKQLDAANETIKSLKEMLPMPDKIKDLQNWSNLNKGIYRYVLAANVAYEIFISHHIFDTDVSEATASLYVAGDWHSKDGDYFERECLAENKTVRECLEAAAKDYADNVNQEAPEV